MVLRLILFAACAAAAFAKTDWPSYGHDPGGARFSPLTQVNTKNVARLERAWTFHTGESGNFETTPIVAGGILYLSTPNQKIVALQPETGRELWSFDTGARLREHRGVSYWPGDRQTPARIVFGTSDGRLMALDARTGKAVGGFGDNGVVDLRAGVADQFPKTVPYAITSPPAI